MKKAASFLKKPSIRLLLSVALLVLCFLMNRYFKTEKPGWNLLQLGVSVVMILVSIPGILSAISQIVRNNRVPTPLPTEPIRIWSHEELFAYLDKDDMVDLDIAHREGLRVSTSSDYRKKTVSGDFEFFGKAYYINDEEYEDFEQFKEQFAVVHPDAEVRILRASLDGNDVALP